MLAGTSHEVNFPREGGMVLVFHSTKLARNENELRIHVFAGCAMRLQPDLLFDRRRIYRRGSAVRAGGDLRAKRPYAFNSAQQLLDYCRDMALSVFDLVLSTELALHDRAVIDEYFADVWQTMAPVLIAA